MDSISAIAGAAHLFLADNVVPLDPKPAMFQAMLEGWEQQQSARFLKEQTITARRRIVRRFAEFTNQYPWEWTAAEVEAFFNDLRCRESPLAPSTGRGYQVVLRLFMDFVTDARYGWAEQCDRRFGAAPVQLLHEWNTVAHRLDYEGEPGRRPLSYDEVQALFDAADGLVDAARALGRKGGLTTQRDAVLLKCVYAFGLRRREAWGLDVVDLGRNPKAPAFGRFGSLFVRHGKGTAGSEPKRRTVLLVPEMDWIVEVLGQWLTDVRPLLVPGAHPALFVTERRGRLSPRGIDTAFTRARAAAGLGERLDLHCLRHSHITHMIEFGYPEKFVQDQVGHAYASTTAIYTGVGDEFRNRLIRQRAATTPRRTMEGTTVIKKMGVTWHLRLKMAEHGLFHTSDLVPLLAERGVDLSREQVFRLVTQTPQRLSMDTLAALCDILECSPADLIEVTAVNTSVRKASGGSAEAAAPPPPCAGFAGSRRSCAAGLTECWSAPTASVATGSRSSAERAAARPRSPRATTTAPHCATAARPDDSTTAACAGSPGRQPP